MQNMYRLKKKDLMKGHLLKFFQKVDYNLSVEDEEVLKHLPPSDHLHLSCAVLLSALQGHFLSF